MNNKTIQATVRYSHRSSDTSPLGLNFLRSTEPSNYEKFQQRDELLKELFTSILQNVKSKGKEKGGHSLI